MRNQIWLMGGFYNLETMEPVPVWLVFSGSASGTDPLRSWGRISNEKESAWWLDREESDGVAGVAPGHFRPEERKV